MCEKSVQLVDVQGIDLDPIAVEAINPAYEAKLDLRPRPEPTNPTPAPNPTSGPLSSMISPQWKTEA